MFVCRMLNVHTVEYNIICWDGPQYSWCTLYAEIVCAILYTAVYV